MSIHISTVWWYQDCQFLACSTEQEYFRCRAIAMQMGSFEPISTTKVAPIITPPELIRPGEMKVTGHYQGADDGIYARRAVFGARNWRGNLLETKSAKHALWWIATDANIIEARYQRINGHAKSAALIMADGEMEMVS